MAEGKTEEAGGECTAEVHENVAPFSPLSMAAWEQACHSDNSSPEGRDPRAEASKLKMANEMALKLLIIPM